jgi:flagellar assembly protein FliH
MAAARKYSFDTEFSPDGTVLSDAVTRRYSQAEVDAERTASYGAGKDDAVAAAERAAAAALKDIAAAARALLAQLNSERAQMREEAALLAMAAARKIAGAALDAFGAERALGAIGDALETLRTQPRLVLRAPPALAGALSPRLEALAADAGYAGALVLREDAKLARAAFAIEWDGGLVRFDAEDAAARIDAIVTHAISQDEEPGS